MLENNYGIDIGTVEYTFKKAKLFDFSPNSGSNIINLDILANKNEILRSDIDNLNKWFNSNKDNYVRLYHGTSSKHDILGQGLLQTSKKTAKSLQSGHGYVYLSYDPNRAKAFGDMAYSMEVYHGIPTVVYGVNVRIGDLKADIDQINNKRSVGFEQIGNSLAESLLYGGGFRVKGKIDSYCISLY